MIASAFGNWLYWWVWSSHGVGNFMDDAVILVVSALLWPRLRHAIERRFEKEKAALHAETHKIIGSHLAGLHEHIEAATGVAKPGAATPAAASPEASVSPLRRPPPDGPKTSAP